MAVFVWVAVSVHAAAAPQRIVSLIPAVTEMLFAIGAGPQVVAVSSFDSYPPQVKSLERVGALLDPNLEKILSLRPDLVAVYGSQTDLRAQLKRAGIGTFVYSHAGLQQITTVLRELGSSVGRAEEASRLARDIDAKIDAIRRRVEGRQRPRTLIVFGREARALRGTHASGGVGFIHEMVVAAGGDNVFADVQREAVQASAEMILTRRPDVVLELRPSLSEAEARLEADAWKGLPALPAVRNGRVYVLTDARTVIPGPRVAQGTELIARLLQPDAFK